MNNSVKRKNHLNAIVFISPANLKVNQANKGKANKLGIRNAKGELPNKR